MDSRVTLAGLRATLSRAFGIPVDKLPTMIDTETIAVWDSLVHLGLIEELEREYGVSISQAERVTMLSEAEIARVLAAKLKS
jgi:acyl carrier protein